MAAVRPIAGTRRRGSQPAEDAALATELLADPKERAEHVMLVDLGAQRRRPRQKVRLGGRARPDDGGAVQPRDAHRQPRGGRIRPGLDAYRLDAGHLPAGTVSSAPRCGRGDRQKSWKGSAGPSCRGGGLLQL